MRIQRLALHPGGGDLIVDNLMVVIALLMVLCGVFNYQVNVTLKSDV